jgi:hypothetical protein
MNDMDEFDRLVRTQTWILAIAAVLLALLIAYLHFDT